VIFKSDMRREMKDFLFRWNEFETYGDMKKCGGLAVHLRKTFFFDCDQMLIVFGSMTHGLT